MNVVTIKIDARATKQKELTQTLIAVVDRAGATRGRVRERPIVPRWICEFELAENGNRLGYKERFDNHLAGYSSRL